jgi:hypothetical protein
MAGCGLGRVIAHPTPGSSLLTTGQADIAINAPTPGTSSLTDHG